MKTNYYEEIKWITQYDGQVVIVKEKDGTITKGRCKVFIEGPYIDMDREMWIADKVISLDDIVNIEPWNIDDDQVG